MKYNLDTIEITPELISRFVMGKTSMEEWLAVLAAMRNDLEIKKIILASIEINEAVSSKEKPLCMPAIFSKRRLSKEIAELANYIAENDHEQWAKIHKDNGWTYGKKIDIKNKKSPYMMPYSELKKVDQRKNLAYAVNTLLLLQELGYNIVRKHNHFTFTPNSRDNLGNYIPSPVNLRGIRIPEHLSKATEYIAEYTSHDYDKAKNTIRFIYKLGYCID